MARRINRAKQLLLKRRLGLVEIALALGFADQAHFCAAFQRAVGLSPGKYREHLAS
ncbi:MAG: helix-turn-helix domain-containing protein [Candidatus Binataceae bacterium]